MISRYPDASDTVPYEQYTYEIARGKVAVAKRIFSRLESEYSGISREGYNE